MWKWNIWSKIQQLLQTQRTDSWKPLPGLAVPEFGINLQPAQGWSSKEAKISSSWGSLCSDLHLCQPGTTIKMSLVAVGMDTDVQLQLSREAAALLEQDLF